MGEPGVMEPRISLVTLGVADLDRAVAFYEGVIGWRKFPGPDGVAFFDLGGIVFGLYPHDDLAADMNASVGSGASGAYRGFALAHNARSEREVDDIFARLKGAGATIVKAPAHVSWGGYSGYFSDADGHTWEVAYNPHWTIRSDGRVSMTKD